MSVAIGVPVRFEPRALSWNSITKAVPSTSNEKSAHDTGFLQGGLNAET